MTREIVADLIGRDRMSGAMKSAERATDSLRDKMSRLSGIVGTATRTMAKAGGMVAGLTSTLGPATLGLVKAGAATAHFAVAAAPLVSTLPAVAGAFALVKGTALMAGPAMAAAFAPVTELFGDEKNPGPLRKRIGELASQGIPELARSFVKVNMPAIGGAMESIAGSMNRVVRSVGAWVNSSEGMSMISTITESTAVEFDLLAPKISRAAIAFGRLVNRGNNVAIEGLASGIGKLLDKFSAWADSVSQDRIVKALDDARNAAGAFGEKLRAVRDVVQWIGDNPGKVKAMSDALAGIGIALGLAGGAWVAVVAGAVTLIANHWDTLKPKFEAAGKWASDTWQKIAADPNVQRIKAALADVGRVIREDFVAAWRLIQPQLERFGSAARDAWAKVGPLVAEFLENPDVRAGLRVIAMGLAAVAAALVVLTAGAAAATAGIVAALGGMTAYMTGVFARTVLNVVSVCLTAFGNFAGSLGRILQHIPGLRGVGDALVGVGEDARAAANKVAGLAAQLNSLKSKQVTVTVRAIGNGVRLSEYSNGQVAYTNPNGSRVRAFAAGGPVKAGRPVMVGELGREMFVPEQDGRIIPNRGLRSAGSGSGGVTVVIQQLVLQGPVMGNPQQIAQAVTESFASTAAGGSLSHRAMREAIGAAAK